MNRLAAICLSEQRTKVGTESILRSFCLENYNNFSFPDSEPVLVKSVSQKLLHEIGIELDAGDNTDYEYVLQVVSCLRICSRDSTFSSEIDTDVCVDRLLDILRRPMPVSTSSDGSVSAKLKAISEAMKCLFNFCKQSADIRTKFNTPDNARVVLDIVRVVVSRNMTQDLLSFGLKLMFISTAFSVEVAVFVLKSDGLSLLVDLASNMSGLAQSEMDKHICSWDVCTLDSTSLNIIDDCLMCAYNLVSWQSDLEDSIKYIFHKFVRVLRHLLICCCKSIGVLRTSCHISSLLMMAPKESLVELLPSVPRRSWNETVPHHLGFPVEFELHDMSAIAVLLHYVRHQLEQGVIDFVTPMLCGLAAVCRRHRPARKYVRYQVLPPLKEASVRPEEQENTKGHIVRLMRRVDCVKDVAADFLFVLCKENVERMVKYTGYGNSAGLLASRGLLSGNKGRVSGDYSSDDDDSETEEYKDVQAMVDPITGAVSEQTEEDPLKTMTPEQKEEEAQKLMGLIKRLKTLGMIQPASIDEAGHISQMDPEKLVSQPGSDSVQS